MTLVPRPSTASPVNSEPVRASENATWSGVWPGVATTASETEPVDTRSPSRIRLLHPLGRTSCEHPRPGHRRERDRAGRVVRVIVGQRDRADRTRGPRDLGEMARIVGPGVDHERRRVPHDPRVGPLELADAGVRRQDADHAHRDQSCQNVERGSRSSSSSSGSRVTIREPEQVVDRTAAGDLGHREEGRPVELATARRPVLEEPGRRDPPRVRGLAAVGHGFESLGCADREVARVEPDRDARRRDPVGDLTQLVGRGRGGVHAAELVALPEPRPRQDERHLLDELADRARPARLVRRPEPPPRELPVLLVGRTPGERHVARQETARGAPLQHQHLEPLLGVARDHGRRRLTDLLVHERHPRTHPHHRHPRTAADGRGH